MYRSKINLSANFILNAKGEKVSCSHVYNLCVARIADGCAAAAALQTVYASITGRPALIDTGRIHDHNKDHHVTVRDVDYKDLAEILLPRLRSIHRTWRAVRLAEADYKTPVEGDPDWLEDVGYTSPVSRANVSL